MPDPLMNALDCPDGTQLTPTRTVSITALQALAMLNDKFIIRQSEHMAERLAAENSRAAGSGNGTVSTWCFAGRRARRSWRP